VSPYLNSKGVGQWKQNKYKERKLKHETKSGHDDYFELPVENELETLMSRIDMESSQSKYDNRNKSQSTDSAINEPSFNSDDDGSDVMRSAIGRSSVEEGHIEESRLNHTQDNDKMRFPGERSNAKAQQKKVSRLLINVLVNL
jgi:hypothetical protein